MTRLDGSAVLISAGTFFMAIGAAGPRMWLVVGMACIVIGLKRAQRAR